MKNVFNIRSVVVLCNVLVVGLFITLVGFASYASEQSILVIGLTADPRGISPAYATTFPDWVVGNRVYSTLFQADENFEATPDLAKSWEVSDDGLTYTFHLREDATFHDGSPVTSEDVVFSIREIALVHCSVCVRGLGNVIESIEAPDDYTVVIHLKSPYLEMLNPYDGIGAMCSGVVKKELYEGMDIFTNPYNHEPVGSGPFKFVEWVRGSHIILERYEGYFGESPAIDKILFRILGDPTARATAFEVGELDWVPHQFPASEIARIDALPGYKAYFHGAPCGSNLELAFNLRLEPFDNKAVRKALTAAIDKQRIADFVYFGGAKAATQHVVRSVFSAWWHNPDAKQIEYDPELSARMLDEAGYPVQSDGWRFHFTLKHTTTWSEHLKVAELIKDDLKKIHVDVKIISLDHAAWIDHFFQKWDFETGLWPCCSGPTPPSMFRWHTDNMKHIAWANNTGFSNAEYDDLYNKMISELDRQKRLEYLYRMQEILVEEQVLGFIVEPLNPTAVNEAAFIGEPSNVWSLGYCWMHLTGIKPTE